ncbi:MAG TPA: sigma 54-interacting transcriptional regulator [Pyrinomonadaceae bacterium]|nr:sigma 54-interacting transcriptional regulator [Pyrinomonadaceae bacterium]
MSLRDLLLDSPDHVQEYIRGLFTKLPFQLCELWVYRPDQEVFTCGYCMRKAANGEVRSWGLGHDDDQLNVLSQGPLWDQMSRNNGNPVEYISDIRDPHQQGFSIYREWLRSQDNQFDIIESLYPKFFVFDEVKQIFRLKDLALVRIFDPEDRTSGSELAGIIRMFNLLSPDNLKAPKATAQQVVLDAVLQIFVGFSFATLTLDAQTKKVKDFGSVTTKDGSLVNICTANANMRNTLELLSKAAVTENPIHLHGDSGTGKEIIARWIHQQSSRRDGMFYGFNIAALTQTLLESDLFGARRGAYSGQNAERIGVLETAGRGTVLIDEIGELPLDLQPKLLRVLEEREFVPLGQSLARPLQARVITSTLRNLEQDVREGRFRADLFHRLNVISVRLPPLRERREDMPLILDSLLEQSNTPIGLSDEVRFELLQRSWRDNNIRELKNFLVILALWAEDSMNITIRDLRKADLHQLQGGALSAFDPSEALMWAHTHKETYGLRASILDIIKVRLVQEAMEMRGSIQGASNFLAVRWNTVNKNLKLYQKYFRTNGKEEEA